jgi:hypothetical protein
MSMSSSAESSSASPASRGSGALLAALCAPGLEVRFSALGLAALVSTFRRLAGGGGVSLACHGKARTEAFELIATPHMPAGDSKDSRITHLLGHDKHICIL